ncbi:MULTISPECIES: ribose ABC transporter substrate-binding protein RbsB [Shouchella]|uniref:Ribose ABC transporter substrate-binding protein RbsB n=2 Tax=Shouchella TaxID=2893057 RepID=A0ABY7WDV0_9BACI|nr:MULTISPECIES: ribose ABC transporter substrate-binding protein RbsB [Shouchella]MED4128785.1 ribose ABC transporter substrate-binding protein RbsB [Shouchella miscanthi]WDF05804.1 ribose ABC transporter substrate-binding protein RbsB [Shouchella hunanensis]
MRKISLTVATMGLAAFLGACSMDSPGSDDANNSNGSGNGEESGEFTVGLSISTLNNPFFVTLEDGAIEKADELGIQIETVDAQDDSSKQVNDVEDLIQRGVDLILINPTDSSAVAAAIQSANNAGIPVITVDRAAEGGEVVTHIASDNIAGGEMAGDYLLELVGEGAQVAELEGIPGASAARERGEGFHNIAEESLDVVTSQPANFDRAEGLTVMENILQSNPDIVGVFAHNDEMALGALEAISAAGRDDIVVVGFDATDDAVASVETGGLAGTIAQQPILIGEEAVQAAYSVLNEEEIDDFIPVELELIRQ